MVDDVRWTWMSYLKRVGRLEIRGKMACMRDVL